MNILLNAKQKLLAVCGLIFTVFTLVVMNSLLMMPVMVPAFVTIKRILLRVI